MLTQKQKAICKKFSAPFRPCDLSLKLGVSRSVENGGRPINGMRIPGKYGTSGWFIWAGEYSEDPDFFAPLHGEHLAERADFIMPYLGLAPGWCFLVTEDYEDVWFNPEILVNYPP